MTKVQIWDDEWWPVPVYNEHFNKYLTDVPMVDVPQVVLDEYDRAEAAFRDACDKLHNYRERKRNG